MFFLPIFQYALMTIMHLYVLFILYILMKIRVISSITCTVGKRFKNEKNLFSYKICIIIGILCYNVSFVQTLSFSQVLLLKRRTTRDVNVESKNFTDE